MRLKTKIIIYVSAVLITLVLAIAWVVFVWIQPARLETLSKATMKQVAASVAYEVLLDLQTDGRARFQRLLKRLVPLDDVYGLAVYDAAGRLHRASPDMVELSPTLEKTVTQQVIEQQELMFVEEILDKHEVRSLWYPIIADDGTVVGALKLTFTFAGLRQYRRESISASLLACTIGLLILVALVYYLLSGVFSRIQAVITKMNTIIRERDLTQRVIVESQDEIGELGDVFNRMVEGLLQLTREIQNAGLRVSSSTEKIVDVAKSHLEAAENLMLSVEEARTGVEELKKLSEQIAGKAETVLSNGEYTLNKTVRGVEVVEELVTEITEIDEINREGVRQINALNAKAEQITEIVTIIEDITANTKLIAFNATIEAARAGESGKGFSVVANEIRSLADSVSDATRSIRKIIQDMQDATIRSTEIETQEREKVEHVTLSVNRTKGHLDMVLKMLDDTVTQAREISLATEEQKISTTRIIEKMQGFFEIAQFTKGSSAETSTSARELDRLAEQLQATVARFKLD
jgi:methyl-accepting chemotaxis protein